LGRIINFILNLLRFLGVSQFFLSW